MSTMSERQLAWLRSNKIGYIFQSFNLMPTLTARRNVALPLIFSGVEEREAEQRAGTVLGKVGLAERLEHLPDQLSGGQRQRVAIARALVNNPAVVLADEPTGNLDLKTGEEILAILKRLQAELGTTVICATHDHKMLSASDRVVWILDGCVERIAGREELNIDIGSMDGETVA
jgi:putative ABC transport system ATP-binding protein